MVCSTAVYGYIVVRSHLYRWKRTLLVSLLGFDDFTPVFACLQRLSLYYVQSADRLWFGRRIPVFMGRKKISCSASVPLSSGRRRLMGCICAVSCERSYSSREDWIDCKVYAHTGINPCVLLMTTSMKQKIAQELAVHLQRYTVTDVVGMEASNWTSAIESGTIRFNLLIAHQQLRIGLSTKLKLFDSSLTPTLLHSWFTHTHVITCPS